MDDLIGWFQGEAVSSQNAEFVAEALKDVTPETGELWRYFSSISSLLLN